jgi:hypothetical protein
MFSAGSSRKRAPYGMALAAVSTPSVRWAGHAHTPAATWGSDSATA